MTINFSLSCAFLCSFFLMIAFFINSQNFSGLFEEGRVLWRHLLKQIIDTTAWALRPQEENRAHSLFGNLNRNFLLWKFEKETPTGVFVNHMLKNQTRHQNLFWRHFWSSAQVWNLQSPDLVEKPSISGTQSARAMVEAREVVPRIFPKYSEKSA